MMPEFHINHVIIQVSLNPDYVEVKLELPAGVASRVWSILTSGVAEADVSRFSVVEQFLRLLFACLNHFHLGLFHVL
jgi:hypothetical protein